MEEDAKFYLEYDKWFRKEYDLPKKYPICISCLTSVLDDGMMGGGGPVSDDIVKITRIDKTDRYGRNKYWRIKDDIRRRFTCKNSEQ
jgi:hypothetical protein